MEHFPDTPKTKWVGEGEMELLEPFTFIDKKGKKWIAPQGAFLNGATIPKALWSMIGAPYVGRYRKSSIVHDYFVGEGENPDVGEIDRRKADKMFYEACRAEGCSRKQATVMYIGVSLGTWWSDAQDIFKSRSIDEDPFDGTSPEDALLQDKFRELLRRSDQYIETEDIDKIEQLVNEELKIGNEK